MTIKDLKYQLEKEIAVKMEELKVLCEDYHSILLRMTAIAEELESVQDVISKQYPDIAEMLKLLVECQSPTDTMVNKFQKTAAETKNKGKK